MATGLLEGDTRWAGAITQTSELTLRWGRHVLCYTIRLDIVTKSAGG